MSSGEPGFRWSTISFRVWVLDIPKQKIPVERDDLENTFLWISEFKLEKEDRIIFFSDGVSQSGMGSASTPLFAEAIKRINEARPLGELFALE